VRLWYEMMQVRGHSISWFLFSFQFKLQVPHRRGELAVRVHHITRIYFLRNPPVSLVQYGHDAVSSFYSIINNMQV